MSENELWGYNCNRSSSIGKFVKGMRQKLIGLEMGINRIKENNLTQHCYFGYALFMMHM